MIEKRRSFVTDQPLDVQEARMIALEKKLVALEIAIVKLRQEVTRTTITLAEADTDIAVLKQRLSKGETPLRHIVRGIDDQ